MSTELESNKVDDGALPAALTFLFAGIGYGLPVLLFPETHSWNGPISPEILNLYTLTAWMGLAHFGYAYHGHGLVLLKQPAGKLLQYVCALLVGGGLLLLLRSLISVQLFSLLAWIYFIPHFIKAELHFADSTGGKIPRLVFWFPTLAFTYFTWTLFFPSEPWNRLGLAMVMTLLFCAMGGLRVLQDARYSPALILGFFFLGEGLVWGMYRKYMDPHFQMGLYIFHVSIASFYHYFRSYGFAMRRQTSQSYLGGVLLINILFAALGWGALRVSGLPYLTEVLDVSIFTFWVALHLVMSDYFSWQKRGVEGR